MKKTKEEIRFENFITAFWYAFAISIFIGLALFIIVLAKWRFGI